jgi:DNA polymerase I
MSNLRRVPYTKPIPAGAETVTKKGQRFARFRTRKGKAVDAPMTDDGNRIRLLSRKWYGEYRDADGVEQCVPLSTDKTAAAVYHDDHLVEMFNTGDVYSAMAQTFYRDELSEADRALSTLAFKAKHKEKRDKMKICTLGIIFGLTAYGLALRLRISPAEAKALLDQFLEMFPVLRRALLETPQYGALCGYASTASGLRRHRARQSGELSNWERNWMKNHPVQGSAATVFKVAGNRLDRLYRRYDARLLVPLHDAYLFEAPREKLSEVAGLTERVLCETVQEHFPVLCPRADVNVSHPECWNKDERFDSIERWLEDPLFSL